MLPPDVQPRPSWRGLVFGTAALAVLVLLTGPAHSQPKGETLRIGTSGTLATASKAQEKAALMTLQSFIKEETGMNDDIVRQKNWRELASKLVAGKLQLGVFHGHEFAWAQEQYPGLKPLALAVNVHRYPVAYVVVKRESPDKKFADLQGQTIVLPHGDNSFLHLFVEHETKQAGKSPEAFFGKINTQESVEDAIDEVVDGKMQAAAADQTALEAYRRRKPGRFAQLREIAHSKPFPPPVVAYADGKVDASTLERFRRGLLDANKKERGQMILTMFRLTGFESVPSDFAKVLAQTRHDYPPEDGKK